jgi:hypothetical protein
LAVRTARFRLTIIEAIVALPIALNIVSLIVLFVSGNVQKRTSNISGSDIQAIEAATNISGTGALSDFSDSPRSHAIPAVTPPGTPQSVCGHHLSYTLQLPSSWTAKKTGSDDVDTLWASHANMNIRVIAEEAKVGTSARAAASACELLKEHSTDISWSEPRPLKLDGRTWLGFVLKCRIDQTPFGY